MSCHLIGLSKLHDVAATVWKMSPVLSREGAAKVHGMSRPCRGALVKTDLYMTELLGASEKIAI